MSLPGCHAVRLGIVTLLSGFVVCAAGQPGGEPRRFDAQDHAKGQRIYERHCAVCHGLDGTGAGPLAAELRFPPADLTRLAAQVGGVFPLETVARAIDGRTTRTRGTRDMPVWGEIFARTSGSEATSTESAVACVAHYVGSLQRLASD
jgi:mono/diheme cytochrome c family protein